MGRGMAWLDTGTFDSRMKRRPTSAPLGIARLKVSCPEEVAWRLGWINDAPRTPSPAIAQSGYGALCKF